MRKNVAVVLAGGSGTRVGTNVPKQFLKVAGKTIVEHTLDAFQKNRRIDEIAIVIHPTYVYTIEDMVLANNWDKVRKILIGGAQRYESSLVAIRAYEDDSRVNLIFHDAVRPLVSQRIIDDVVEALEQYDAVDTAISAVDTIIRTRDDGRFIDAIPDRSYLRRGQTPQGFKINIIKRAYEIALRDDDFSATDDCGIVLKYLPGVPIYIVDGEESNMKLTYMEDIFLVDKLFQLRSESFRRTDADFDLQGQVLVVFGGNSGIGKDIIKIATGAGAKAYAFSRSLNGIDIRVKDAVDNALNDVYEMEGKIDYVVNASAILRKEPLMNMDDESIRQVIETNYLGMVNVSISSFSYLKETQGQLLHFTSSSYTRGRAFYSLYSSTKAGVVNFVQALAEEWQPFDIRVNCINPERTKTPMREKNFGLEPEETLLKSAQVAEAAIHTLLSDFTGQVVDVRLTDFRI